LVLAINGDAFARDLVPELPFALLFGQSVIFSVQKLLRQSTAISQRLSNRESEILHWCAVGKTSWEISHILNVSQSTIVFHVGNAMKKLGAGSRQSACAKAISLGLIRL
jgi:DNA-binding CsgD family transcriptional regulator